MSGSDPARQVRDRWRAVRIVFSSGGDIGRTGSAVADALQLSDAFKRWNGAAFGGKFLMSVFEVISKGISENLPALRLMRVQKRSAFIVQTAKDLWSNQTFSQNSGAGVRGTTRLTRLLPLAPDLLKP